MPAPASPALPALFVSLSRTLDVKAGDLVLAGPAGPLTVAAPLPRLGAGVRLEAEAGKAAFLVLEPCWSPGPAADAAMVPALRLLALADVVLDPGPLTLEASKTGLSLAWIILSDKASQGQRTDECGPVILEACRAAMDVGHAQGFIIPDDPPELTRLLAHLALGARFDCILTSGGTGVAPRDTAPETTARLLDKRLPGFERAMTNASLAKTPHGAISRAVAGTLGPCLVVNLPGSPKAVRENLAAIVRAIPHAVAKLQGDPADCAQK